MENYEELLTEILKEIRCLSSALTQKNKESESEFKRHLKAFNTSTPMLILGTTSTLSGIVMLLLGSLEVLSEQLSINEKTLKKVKGITALTLLSCLTACSLAVGCNELWKKCKKSGDKKPEEPPSFDLSSSSCDKVKTQAGQTCCG